MSRHKRIYLLFTGLSVLYIAINLAIPPQANTLTRYDITVNKAQLLELTVLLPYVAIWFAASYGSAQLSSYVELIKKSKDGKSLSKIADGHLLLAIAMPVTALLNTVVNFMSQNNNLSLATGTIITNYIDVLFGIFAMLTIYKGSAGLAKTLHAKAKSASEPIFMLSFAILSITFIYLSLTNPARQFPAATTGRAAYYLPDFLLITTIILPYLFIWFLGFRAAHNVQLYRSNVSGQIYRNSLGYLATGILFVVLARICLRFFASMGTILTNFSLTYLLMIIYLLLLIISAGFVVIAIGSKKLKKIEEV